jgi:hypothetical protein
MPPAFSFAHCQIKAREAHFCHRDLERGILISIKALTIAKTHGHGFAFSPHLPWRSYKILTLRQEDPKDEVELCHVY